MAIIRSIRNPWRDQWLQAQFRNAMFYVESDAQAGGRRLAPHQYPKRNTPYTEDMGREARTYLVQAYLIGPNPIVGNDYRVARDLLIDALEQDGPGWLRLPLPYRMADVYVMVKSYSVTETREKGGFCTIDMTFVEYGDPVWHPTIATADQVQQAAGNMETTVIGQNQPTDETAKQAAQYASVYQDALTSTGVSLTR